MTSHPCTPQRGAIKREVISKFSSIFQDSSLCWVSPLNASQIKQGLGLINSLPCKNLKITLSNWDIFHTLMLQRTSQPMITCPAWADKHTKRMRNKPYKAPHITAPWPGAALPVSFSLGHPQSTKREGKWGNKENAKQPAWLTFSLPVSLTFLLPPLYLSFFPSCHFLC